MTPATIIEAMSSIWSPWFKDAKTWAPWRVFLAVLFGLPLTDADLATYRERTGRTAPPPPAGFTEAWLVCGRRAGKSFILALIACYLAVFRDWSAHLIPGETGCIKIIATDRRQARTIYRYARALLTQVPTLAPLVANDGDDGLELTNGIVIEVATANFRSVRSYTTIACLGDEIAYWRHDETSANPDAEILNAIRPSMATIPGAMLLCASSPYARKGELWRAFRSFHGKDDGRALVWHAETRQMNPTVPQSIVDDALAEDPAKAGAEYLALFRSDIETYVPRDVVDAAVIAGRHELTYAAGTQYHAFTDPSGGNSDSFTLAICHREKSGRIVLDLVREVRAPFDPATVVATLTQILRTYGLATVTGDHYAGEWPTAAFRAHGITYQTSERPKSQLYLEALPLLNSYQVDLLDDGRLVDQIANLERRTARGGRDSVDHAPGAHDDVANSALGAVVLAADKRGFDGAALSRAATISQNPAAHAMTGQHRAMVEGIEKGLRGPDLWRHATSAEATFGSATTDPPPTVRMGVSQSLLQRSAQRCPWTNRADMHSSFYPSKF